MTDLLKVLATLAAVFALSLTASCSSGIPTLADVDPSELDYAQLAPLAIVACEKAPNPGFCAAAVRAASKRLGAEEVTELLMIACAGKYSDEQCVRAGMAALAILNAPDPAPEAIASGIVNAVTAPIVTVLPSVPTAAVPATAAPSASSR